MNVNVSQGHPAQPAQQQQLHPSQGHHKTPRILACVLCQHRKIKCDRNTPCSNCIKANVPCTPSTPAPVRKRRRPNQDLQERLARCEALLKQYASATSSLPNVPANPSQGQASHPPQPPSSTTSTSTPPLQPSTGPGGAPSQASSSVSPSMSASYDRVPSVASSSADDGASKWMPAGKLVVEDGSVKFMDSYLWATIHDNVQAMREIVDADAMEEQSPLSSDAVTPDANVDLLLNDLAAIDLDDVVPTPVQIFRLWQVYLERVNPLTKLVHVPTLQPIVVEAAANHRNVPNNSQALLFGIYLMATVTMTEAESRQMLDLSRDEAMKRFTAGVKSALTKVNFLKNYDMVTLQALVLYLCSLQGRYNRHAIWIISGVLIRIAQKMGLHRDGERLGLTPFETEMRRRVWWQIIMLDSKFAVCSGFSETLLPWGWDTKSPQNVNDANLFPGSTEPITAQDGPTEMVFCLMMYEIGRFISETRRPDFEEVIMESQAAEPGTASYAANQASLAEYRRRLEELDAKLATLEQRYCDPSAGSIHQAAANIRPFLIDKVRAMLTPMRESPEWGTEVNNVNDNMFRIFLYHSECTFDAYDQPDQRNYIWFYKLTFHLDVFIYLVGQLYQRSPTGNFADRAWRVIERVYHHHEELSDMTQKRNIQLGFFVLKAWAAREQALSLSGSPLKTPRCITRLRDCLPPSMVEPSSSRVGSSQPMKADMMPNMDLGEPQLDLLGGLFDTSTLDWDMWGDMGNPATGNPTAASMAALGGFGGFGSQSQMPW